MTKAKIVSMIDVKQEWLDEVKEHIPDIEFEVRRTTTKLQVWYNTALKSFYGVFAHLRQLVDAPTGVRYRVYVTSRKNLQAWGITNHLALYDNQDRDGVLDFYMGLPENMDRRAIANGFRSNFAWLFVHEALHGKEQESGREYLAATNSDRTHDWEAEGRLPELIQEHFIIKLQKQSIGLLQTLLGLLLGGRIQHPVPGFPVSQPYGVPNSRYPLTGHHIGTDYATPIGTPVRMPVSGNFIHSGYTPALGSFLVVEYTYRGRRYQSRFAHLENITRYRRGEAVPQGDIIGRTGNSGDSSGPHLHVDIWNGSVNLTGITATNFRQRTVDPVLHYNS